MRKKKSAEVERIERDKEIDEAFRPIEKLAGLTSTDEMNVILRGDWYETIPCPECHDSVLSGKGWGERTGECLGCGRKFTSSELK